MQPPQIVNPVLGGQDVRNVGGNQMDVRNPDPRDIRLSNGYVCKEYRSFLKLIHSFIHILFPKYRPHFNIPMAHPRDARDLIREISRDVRGDLRGISGMYACHSH